MYAHHCRKYCFAIIVYIHLGWASSLYNTERHHCFIDKHQSWINWLCICAYALDNLTYIKSKQVNHVKYYFNVRPMCIYVLHLDYIVQTREHYTVQCSYNALCYSHWFWKQPWFNSTVRSYKYMYIVIAIEDFFYIFFYLKRVIKPLT